MRVPRFLWFFAALAVLGLVAMVVPLYYNLRQQLTADDLAAARALWHERGPGDYDLDYTIRLDDDPRGQECHVEVRGGAVTSARCDGQPAAEPLTVEALFELMDAALAEDAASGRRNFTVARFDPHDGHPLRYVRQVRARRERLEVLVRLRRAGAAR